METRGYKQNRIVIMLVALAGMSVYLLPYFRYYYYDAYVSYFGINDLQMGTLGSIYGVLAIVGYCLGGRIVGSNRTWSICTSSETGVSNSCRNLCIVGRNFYHDILESMYESITCTV